MFFLTVLTYTLVVALCLKLAAIRLESLLRQLGPNSLFTLATMLLIPGTALLAWWDLRWSRRVLRQALNERGKPTCMSCGYDLRGLPPAQPDGTTICPECRCAWRFDAAGVED